MASEFDAVIKIIKLEQPLTKLSTITLPQIGRAGRDLRRGGLKVDNLHGR